jgi:hypothetical protein
MELSELQGRENWRILSGERRRKRRGVNLGKGRSEGGASTAEMARRTHEK